MQAIEVGGQPLPSACQLAYCEAGLWVSPWVVIPLKEPFEFKASQSMALSHIHSLDSDQTGSFRVCEQEHNTSCENTQGNESFTEFNAPSYTASQGPSLYVSTKRKVFVLRNMIAQYINMLWVNVAEDNCPPTSSSDAHSSHFAA